MSTNQINQKVNTKRERRWEQAVRLAKEGKTYWQIAKEMGISQQGVWLHLVSHGYKLSELKPKTATAPKKRQKLYKWESAPVFNGQKISGYVWAISSESALRKLKTLKESPIRGIPNADPTVTLTAPPSGIYHAIGYNPKKK